MPDPFSQSSQNHLAKAINEALNLHQRGDLDGAEKAYRRVLKTWPDQFDALHLYGMLNFQRGKLSDALKLLNQAVRIDPRVADVHSNLGIVLATLKRNGEAMASFDKAVALQPNNVGALINRGRALVESGRADEGLASIDKALSLDPRHVEGRINRANALVQLGRHEDALREYDQAITAVPNHPGHPGAYFNRGNVLFSLGRPDEAVEAYQRALAINPKSDAAWNSRGVALQALNRNTEAIESFQRALSLKADHADAHFNVSLALLAAGDYPRGFREYEWRWKRTGMPEQRKFSAPAWTGEQALGGKTILLHAEQGLGDSVMFARYVPELARRGARVVLEVQPELKALLCALEGAAQVIARGDELPEYDLQCPLGSLPLAFRTEFASVPAPIPYLTAPADRVAKWRERMSAFGSPRIALAWAGSAQHVNDRNRSIPLAALHPLLAAEALFVGVQRDMRPDDASAMMSAPRLKNLGGEIEDLADTAAILSLCDLVISVDTSVAHVAGAIGRPLWMLIPFAPDWRWTLGGTSPWYPQARLFRQPHRGDWPGAIADMAGALAQRG